MRVRNSKVKKAKPPLRLERWLIIFLMIYFLLAMEIGIWINALIERNERNLREAPQGDHHVSP